MATKIGVLALQGGFEAHCLCIERLGCKAVQVRYPKDLEGCDALVLPGGESTTMTIQAERVGLITPLISFADTHPLFGTCAGAILMARFKLLDVMIRRNAYGRQVASFVEPLTFQGQTVPAMFIRAPIIEDVAPHVTVLATHRNNPVFIQQGNHFATTFHPELTDDDTLYQFILEKFYEVI